MVGATGKLKVMTREGAKRIMEEVETALQMGYSRVLSEKEVEKAVEKIRKTREEIWKERLAPRS